MAGKIFGRKARWRVAAGVVAALLLLGGIGLYQMAVPVWVPWTSEAQRKAAEAEQQRLKEEEQRQAKTADLEAKLKAAEAEQQRLEEEVKRQAQAAADAEAKRKAAEAEQQRLKEEEQRQAKAEADAEAKRKAAEAEQQRLAAIKEEEQRQSKAADLEAKLKAAEAEQQRLREEAQRQAKAAADAEAKRKAAEAEQQRLKEEQQRQAQAAADAEAKRKAAEAEQQRLAAVKAEEERKAKAEQAEKERLGATQAEQERKAKAAAEAEAKARAEQVEKERLAAAKSEEERKAKSAAEAEAKRKAEAPAKAPAEGLPEFPWPPPRASASYVLPDGLFESHRSVGEVVAAILLALERNGYVERSFFRTKADGVALVTRLERIRDDGSAFAEPERWALLRSSPDDFGPNALFRFLRGLFVVDPGRYRIIVFILQGPSFSQSPQIMIAQEAQRWLFSGANVLPPEVAKRPFSGAHCTVMIYEFSSDGTQVRVVESRLTGKDHLAKAGVLSFLEKSN
jgi:hypothetical protein